MRPFPIPCVAALVLCAASAPFAVSTAQEPPRAVPSDPTAPDERLRAALGQDASASTPTIAASARVVLPELALRGLVIASGKPGTALVAVGERLVRVTPGSTIVLDAASNVQARVVEVSAAEVVLEVGARSERRVLR